MVKLFMKGGYYEKKVRKKETSKTKKMMEFLRLVYRYLCGLFDNTCAMLCGLFSASIGYFLPVKDIVHLLIFFFIVDVFFGWRKARKLKKMKFSTAVIWNTTMPRMGLSILLIMCAYMWDNTFDQNYVSTYKVIGWFISGVILYSIVANMYVLTNWKVFKDLVQIVKNCVKGKTGIDIEN